jgi:hypothetical protein
MLHFGKTPNEDKVIIEVSEESLNDLHEILLAAPLPQRRKELYALKALLEDDKELSSFINK